MGQCAALNRLQILRAKTLHRCNESRIAQRLASIFHRRILRTLLVFLDPHRALMRAK